MYKLTYFQFVFSGCFGFSHFQHKNCDLLLVFLAGTLLKIFCQLVYRQKKHSNIHPKSGRLAKVCIALLFIKYINFFLQIIKWTFILKPTFFKQKNFPFQRSFRLSFKSYFKHHQNPPQFLLRWDGLGK